MDKWYKMDILRNVTGPYSSEGIKRQALKGLTFWVGGSGAKDWISVHEVKEFISGAFHGSRPDDKESNKTRALERGVDELIGLCKGIIADGRVEPDEAQFLKSWLENNSEVAKVWPAKVLAERIAIIFADGVVDEEEQTDLAELLTKFTGVMPGFSNAEQLATRLPIDDPAPGVEFPGKKFCLTGKFIFGSRMRCEKVIVAKGGIIRVQPEADSDYLVIGALGSSEWIHSSYGRKIEQVLENRRNGANTLIIAEEHWTFFIN